MRIINFKDKVKALILLCAIMLSAIVPFIFTAVYEYTSNKDFTVQAASTGLGSQAGSSTYDVYVSTDKSMGTALGSADTSSTYRYTMDTDGDGIGNAQAGYAMCIAPTRGSPGGRSGTSTPYTGSDYPFADNDSGWAGALSEYTRSQIAVGGLKLANSDSGKWTFIHALLSYVLGNDSSWMNVYSNLRGESYVKGLAENLARYIDSCGIQTNAVYYIWKCSGYQTLATLVKGTSYVTPGAEFTFNKTDGSSYVSGAVVTLTSSGSGAFDEVQISGSASLSCISNGYQFVTGSTGINITGLKAGTSYVIHEVTPPEGFNAADDITVNVSSAGKVSVNGTVTSTVTMVDKPKVYSGSCSFIKISSDTGEVLQNAVISFYADAGSSSDAMTNVTASNGQTPVNGVITFTTGTEAIVFDGLAPDCKYIFEEVSAPEGYLCAPRVVITTDSEGNVNENAGSITMSDQEEEEKPVYGSIALRKTYPDGDRFLDNISSNTINFEIYQEGHNAPFSTGFLGSAASPALEGGGHAAAVVWWAGVSQGNITFPDYWPYPHFWDDTDGENVNTGGSFWNVNVDAATGSSYQGGNVLMYLPEGLYTIKESWKPNSFRTHNAEEIYINALEQTGWVRESSSEGLIVYSAQVLIAEGFTDHSLGFNVPGYEVLPNYGLIEIINDQQTVNVDLKKIDNTGYGVEGLEFELWKLDSPNSATGRVASGAITTPAVSGGNTYSVSWNYTVIEHLSSGDVEHNYENVDVIEDLPLGNYQFREYFSEDTYADTGISYTYVIPDGWALASDDRGSYFFKNVSLNTDSEADVGFEATVSNTRQTGSIKVNKHPNVGKGDGFVFEMFYAGSAGSSSYSKNKYDWVCVGTVTTSCDSGSGDGYASYNNLPYGWYLIREIGAEDKWREEWVNSDGSAARTVVIDGDTYVAVKLYSGGASAEISVTCNNYRRIGWANIIKSVSNSEVPINGYVLGNSFEGTKYAIYMDSDGNGSLNKNSDTLIAEVLLDSNGKVSSVNYVTSVFEPVYGFEKANNRFELPSGKFFATEVCSASPYFLSDEVYSFTVVEAPVENPDSVTATVTTVNAVDDLASARIDFDLDKTTFDGWEITGAEFTLYSNPECTEVVAVLTDNSDGHYVTGLNSGLYYSFDKAARQSGGTYSYSLNCTYYMKETSAPESVISSDGVAYNLDDFYSQYINDGNVYEINVQLTGVGQYQRTGKLSWNITGGVINESVSGSISSYNVDTGYKTNKIKIANSVDSNFWETPDDLSLVKRTETAVLSNDVKFNIEDTVFSLYEGDKSSGTLIAVYKYSDGKWNWYDVGGNLFPGSEWKLLKFETGYTVYEEFPQYYYTDSVTTNNQGIPYEVTNITPGWMQIDDLTWSYSFETPSRTDSTVGSDYSATNNLRFGTIEIHKVWSQERTNGEDLSGYEFVFEYGGRGDYPKWTGIYITEVTDGNGDIILDSIPTGWYRIRETNECCKLEWSSGVDFDTDESGFEYAVLRLSDRQEISYKVINLVRVSIFVNKVDEWTGEIIADYEGESVRFALYTDYDGDGELDPEEELTNYAVAPDRDKDGRVVFPNIAPGDYLVVEQVAPFGFYININVFPVHVYEAVNHTVNVEDTPYTASVRINKFDSDTNEVLSDAEFVVYADVNSNGVYDADTDLLAQVYDYEQNCLVNAEVKWSDASNCYMTDPLRSGDYVIVETKLPTGYYYCDEDRNPVSSVNQIGITITDKDCQGSDFFVDTYSRDLYNCKPEINTVFLEEESQTHLSPVDEDVILVDYVNYRNLLPGSTYTVTGVLMNKSTGMALVNDDGGKITSSVTFTADSPTGQAEVVFTVNTRNLILANDDVLEPVQIVAFETLYSEPGVELAVHADIDDDNQTVTVGSLHTTAVDSGTGSHTATDGLATIIDTVKYSGLVPGKEYTVNGSLHIVNVSSDGTRTDGGPITSGDGTEILNNSVTFTPETSDGEIRVEFKINTDRIEGRDFVVFEDLYHEGKLIMSHSDINDSDQTIHVPEIHTGACCVDTVCEIAAYSDTVTITDRVYYSNLEAGKTYIVDGAMRWVAIDEDGVWSEGPVEGVSPALSFTATSTEGFVDIEFTVDTEHLSTFCYDRLIACENLWCDGSIVARHFDVTDENQTVYIPHISTQATDSVTGGKTISDDQTVKITDDIYFENLVAGRTYTISGTIMYAKTDENGNIIQSGEIIQNDSPVTASGSFTPQESWGRVQLEFEFDRKFLPDADRIVVFENVYYNGVLIGVHADINDESQTVFVPDLSSAASVGNNLQVSSPSRNVTVYDQVFYEGLTAGREYIVETDLMNTETQSSVSHVTTNFSPDSSNGSVTVEAHMDARGYTKQKIVVFEKVYDAKTGKLIKAHTDWNEQKQTIRFETYPSTGQAVSVSFIAGAVCLISGAGVVILLILKKKFID